MYKGNAGYYSIDESALAGDALSQYRKGRILLLASKGFDEDYIMGRYWIRKAAE